MINATFLNVYLILQYHFFFYKEVYFFECLHFSEYDIQNFYMIFWQRKGTSIKYVRTWQLVEDGKITQNVDNFVQGQRMSCLMCTNALTLSLFVFLAAFLSYSVLFCLQKFGLIFIQNRCVREKRLIFSNKTNFYRHEKAFLIIVKIIFASQRQLKYFQF